MIIGCGVGGVEYPNKKMISIDNERKQDEKILDDAKSDVKENIIHKNNRAKILKMFYFYT